nr:MAG TPA: Membrane fusion protein p14 fusion protein transmembrane domain [Caudoviricetes sp.]
MISFLWHLVGGIMFLTTCIILMYSYLQNKS